MYKIENKTGDADCEQRRLFGNRAKFFVMRVFIFALSVEISGTEKARDGLNSVLLEICGPSHVLSELETGFSACQ